MLTDERYKQLMEDVGLPNSISLLQALKQCAMEAALIERAAPVPAMPIPKQEPAGALRDTKTAIEIIERLIYENKDNCSAFNQAVQEAEDFIKLLSSQSPAMAAHDDGLTDSTDYVQSIINKSNRASPRITEQDAREIAKSAMSAVGYMHFDEWMVRVCPELLNKLNANAVPSQAAAMPEYLSAIEVLRENIRNPDRGVEYCGIFDNDKTRAAIGNLLSAAPKPE